nr:MAG TPA: hypothetical protein [Caudoviricetes sp.]
MRTPVYRGIFTRKRSYQRVTSNKRYKDTQSWAIIQIPVYIC